MPKRRLTVPEQHQLKIAKATLRMPPAMVSVMGGPDIAESRRIIKELTGKTPYQALRDDQMAELRRIKGKGFMPGGRSQARITPKTPRLRR